MSGIGALLAVAAPYGSLPGGGSGLSVSASPPQSNGGGTTGPFATPPVQAIPAGGSGSYTYVWIVVDGTHTIVIASPTAGTTGLSFTGVASGEEASGTVRCTVTDTVTAQTGSVDVPMAYTRFGFS